VEDGSHIYLLLYVDDMLIASQNLLTIQKLKSLLNSEFEMKEMGAAKKFLGMEIKRVREAIFVSKGIHSESAKSFWDGIRKTSMYSSDNVHSSI